MAAPGSMFAPAYWDSGKFFDYEQGGILWRRVRFKFLWVIECETRVEAKFSYCKSFLKCIF